MSISLKRIIIAALILCAATAFAQNPNQDRPNYLLFRVGSQSIDDADAGAFLLQEFSEHFEALPSGVQIASVDTSGQTFAVTEGHHFTKWVALEGTLSWSGEHDLIATDGTNDYRMTSQFFDFELAGMFTYHFKPWLFAYGKAGADIWSISYETSVGRTDGGTDDINFQGLSLALGAGVQANFNEQYSVALSWNKTEVEDLDVSRLTLGVGFIF